MKMTIEELKLSFTNPAMTSIINMTRPNIDMTTSYYKSGFIDGGINGEPRRDWHNRQINWQRSSRI